MLSSYVVERLVDVHGSIFAQMSALVGRVRLLFPIGRRRPAGEQAQRVLGGGAGLGAVPVEHQAGVGDEFERLVGQADVAYHRMVEVLDPGPMLAHVMVGPAGAEDLAAGGELAN